MIEWNTHNCTIIAHAYYVVICYFNCLLMINSTSSAVTCGWCASGTFKQQLETQLQTQPSPTTAHLEHTTMQRTTCHILHLSLMWQESTSHTRLVLGMSLSQMTFPTSTEMVLSWQGGTWTALSDTLSALRWGESKHHMHTAALHSLLACVFSLLQVMPMARRRRDAIPNRQYDVFQSTGYSTVSMGELWYI